MPSNGRPLEEEEEEEEEEVLMVEPFRAMVYTNISEYNIDKGE
jgi:hypothetical protein